MPCKFLIFLTFTFFCPTVAFVQNPCSELLKDGLYSYVKEITYFNDNTRAYSEICSAYQEYKQNNNVISANAKYKQIFKASGSYSKEEIEYIGKMYCEESFLQKEMKDFSERYRSFVDPNLRDMYIECLKANSEGILYPTKNQGEQKHSDLRISNGKIS